MMLLRAPNTNMYNSNFATAQIFLHLSIQFTDIYSDAAAAAPSNSLAVWRIQTLYFRFARVENWTFTYILYRLKALVSPMVQHRFASWCCSFAYQLFFGGRNDNFAALAHSDFSSSHIPRASILIRARVFILYSFYVLHSHDRGKIRSGERDEKWMARKLLSMCVCVAVAVAVDCNILICIWNIRTPAYWVLFVGSAFCYSVMPAAHAASGW